MNASYTDKSNHAEIHYAPQPTKEEMTADAKKLSAMLAAQKGSGQQSINPSFNAAGTHTYTIVDGRGTYTHSESVHGSSTPVNNSGGILSTATDSAGLPVLNLTDQSMVDVGGMRTTIETAVRLGFLTKSGPGQYAEPGNVGLKKSEPLAPGASSSMSGDAPLTSAPEDDFSKFEEMERLAAKEAGMVDAETEAQIESVYQTVGKEGADNLVNRYMGALSAGNDGAMEQLTVEFGGQLGVDPGVLKGQMGGILEKFTEQGARYMSGAHGIDGRDAIEWARENLAPESIMRLAQMQFFKGDLRGYDELATAYKWAKKGKLS